MNTLLNIYYCFRHYTRHWKQKESTTFFLKILFGVLLFQLLYQERDGPVWAINMYEISVMVVSMSDIKYVLIYLILTSVFLKK